MRKTLVLIFGGHSSEHEVSINSAKNIHKAIDTDLFDVVLAGISKQGTWYSLSTEQLLKVTSINDNDFSKEQCISLVSYLSKPTLIFLESNQHKKIDCAFPIVHGTNGEDGALQGLLKMLNIPFVGCDVLSSAVCMDKEFMKVVLTQAGIPNSKYIVVNKSDKYSYENIKNKLGSPFFIKPANTGSSVGVHKVKSESDFPEKIKDSFLYDHKVIAEEFIQGQELECSVKGLNSQAQASLAGELIVKHEFYSYEAKYLDANGAEIVIPAQISETSMQKVREMAVKAYKALSCDGLARVDFFLKPNGELVVNEINTLPGFTKISMYPKMWEATGTDYKTLITELVQFAFDKFDKEASKKKDYL